MENDNTKKLKPAVTITPIDLPKELENATVRDLMSKENTETKIKKNHIIMRKHNAFGTAIAEQEISESGRMTITQSTTPSVGRKEDYLNIILELRREGFTRDEIAFRINKSKSFVSRVLKEYNS